MALTSVVDLPGEENKKLRIEFKNSGHELYWIDNTLIQDISAIGKGKTHNRKIPIDGYDVELTYSFLRKQTYANIYIDGLLYKNDIFDIE